jgi:hypothetical protein
MEKGREETTINLLKMGMLTNEQIAQATNLPVFTIEALANGKGKTERRRPAPTLVFNAGEPSGGRNQITTAKNGG